MEEIAVSKFKAQCLAILERVRKSGKSIRVTRFGHIIAEINPPRGSERVPRLGTGRGKGVILGDIIGPAGEESDWEALKENDEATNSTPK